MNNNYLIHLLVVDEKMNTCELSLEPWQFKQLQIKNENVKKHKSRRALNEEITIFLNSKTTI